MKAKANKAKGATSARRTVEAITPEQARDELRAREIAKRLNALFFHCEEAQATIPDEPLFSFESMLESEIYSTKSDGTQKRAFFRAIDIFIKDIQSEFEDRPRRIAAWKARKDEIRREDFIDRHAESRAFFEKHKNDPDKGRGAIDEYREICRAENERNEQEAAKDIFYYVTPKTPKPECRCWIDKAYSQWEDRFLMWVVGKQDGQAYERARQRENTGFKSLDCMFKDAEKLAVQIHGNAAAKAIKAAREIYIAFTSEESPDDVKTMQRERVADWIKTQYKDELSIPWAALQFGNEIEEKRAMGGYSSVESLMTALYKFKDELGIASFMKRGK